jgi:hypothetical protein
MKNINPGRRVTHAANFLRMAAIELRRWAEKEPGMATQLCRLADQLDAEAASLRQAADGQEGVGFV